MPLIQHDSGLFVAEHVAESDAVERALNRIDHPLAGRLFVTREVDPGYGSFVFRVMVDNGDHPAECITEWRDDYGRPLPLSSSVVDKVQKQIRSGENVVERIMAQNEKQKARVQKDIDDAFEAIADDLSPKLRETRSALLHRGVHLRRSREKSLRSGRDARREFVGDKFRRMAE